MHLVQREHLPEPNNGDAKRKHKSEHNHQDEPTEVLSTSANPNSTTPGCCDACSISWIYSKGTLSDERSWRSRYFETTTVHDYLECCSCAGGFSFSYSRCLSNRLACLSCLFDFSFRKSPLLLPPLPPLHQFRFGTSSMLFVLVISSDMHAHRRKCFFSKLLHFFLFSWLEINEERRQNLPKRCFIHQREKHID